MSTETRRDILEALLDVHLAAQSKLLDDEVDPVAVRTIRAAWVDRFEGAEPTGVDLVAYLSRVQTSHEALRNCPGCGEDLAIVGLTRIAYTFDTCSCGGPDYPHLVEQLWHRTCLQTSPAAANANTAELLDVAVDALERKGPGSATQRDQVVARIKPYLRRIHTDQRTDQP